MALDITQKQKDAFERGKALLAFYKEISPEHQDTTINQSVSAGDMIADIQFTMSHVFNYPEADVESVRIVALNELRFDHTKD